jgi:hypothetical protein
MQKQKPIPPVKGKPLGQISTPRATDPVVDVTDLFRRAGLPCRVVSSARFADRHQLRVAVAERPEHYALIWTVRSALAGSLPARRFKTSSGELLLIEYAGFPDGDGQDKVIWVAVLRPAPGLVQLVLPEELEGLV